MPDPHLRKAMVEIRKLLHRYRIGGCITLVSPTHAEWAYQMPHWSIIQPETGPHGEQGFRIKSQRAYYRTLEEQKAAFAASLHCVLQMRDIGAQTFQLMDQVRECIERAGFEITHVPFSGFEPNEDVV